MFGYYLDLAWRSLRRHWIMTGLMVLAIGLGIGASMTMLTVMHVMTGDPLPGRSAHLYRPYLNPLPLDHKPSQFGPDPSLAFTWPDAKALLDAHKAVRQAAMARGELVASSGRPDVHPRSVHGSYTTRDFFPMFGVSFVAGAVWSSQDESRKAAVVVLTQRLARRLFGDESALGKVAHLGEHDFQVVGVVSGFNPQPFFYANSQTRRFGGTGDDFFLPLTTAMSLRLGVNSMSAWGDDQSLTSPVASWLEFWVELDSPAQITAYRRFLAAYSAQQRDAGRFERPEDDAHLYTLMGWLEYEGLVPADVRLQMWLAVGFLLVCLTNIVALLLAKFLRRSGEISVRRALGARRFDVFKQFAVESALMGVAGGALGIAVAELGLWTVRSRPDDYAQLAHMDMSMLFSTVILAIVASSLAGLVPAWRVCRVAPALQLKTL